MLIRKYIKDNFINIILELFSILIFGLCLFLYQIEFEIILYPSMLVALIFLIRHIFEYYKYRKKYINLSSILENFDISDISSMFFSGKMESLYGEVFMKLVELNKEEEKIRAKKLGDQEDFFIMWTHQMKLPISAIQLDLELDKKLDKRELRIQLNRIKQYTDMVLAYIRLNSKEFDFLIEEVDLEDLVKQTVKKFKNEFINKNIGIKIKNIDRKFISDKKWFSLVLEQILSNALKYTREGTISIYIEDENLYIEDTGIGISKADLPRVFEKGYTGFNGRQEDKSSGLGLYLCRSVCDKLAHSISINSELGKGSQVLIGLNRYEFIGE